MERYRIYCFSLTFAHILFEIQPCLCFIYFYLVLLPLLYTTPLQDFILIWLFILPLVGICTQLWQLQIMCFEHCFICHLGCGCGAISRSRTAGSQKMCVFSFSSYCRTIFQSAWTSAFKLSVYDSSRYSIPLLTLSIPVMFISVISHYVALTYIPDY